MKKNKLLKICLTILCCIISLTIIPLTNTYAQPKSSQYTQQQPLSVQSGNYLYFNVNKTIYKVNVNTKKVSKLITINSLNSVYELTTSGDYIYFLGQTKQGNKYRFYIYRVKKDGTNLKRLVQGCNINISGDYIYFLKSSGYFGDGKDETILGIYRMSKNGTNQKLIKKSSKIEYIKVHSPYIYYQNSPESNISIMKTNGQYCGSVKNSSSDMIIGATKNYLYTHTYDTTGKYSNSSNNLYIRKYNLSSKKWSSVVSSCYGWNMDNGWIYYSRVYPNSDTVKMYKKNLSTNKVVHLASSAYFTELTISSKYILYSDICRNDNYNHVYLVKSDGSQRKEIFKFY